MTIPVEVQANGRAGFPHTYWVSPDGATVSINVVNGPDFPLLIRIITAIMPKDVVRGSAAWWETERVEIKRVLFPKETFAFEGRAVAFVAGGDALNDSRPDLNASKGTAVIDSLA